MALTQVKTSGIADDAIDITKLKAGTDGELITYDASGNPAKVDAGTSGHFLKSQGAGSVPVFAAVPAGGISDIVSDTSPQLGGDLDTNDFEIKLDDSHNIKFGDGDGSNGADLKIRHDGTNNHIEGLNGSTNIGAVEYVNIRSTDSAGSNAKWMIRCHNDAEVGLYHNNTLQCETSANGLAFPSGKGIDFSATADGGGSATNSELFDDYEEGTWTPVVQGSSVTQYSQTGWYTKIGNIVHFGVYVTVSGGTANNEITGLPYAVSTGEIYNVFSNWTYAWWDWSITDHAPLVVWAQAGGSKLLLKQTDWSGMSGFPDVNFGGGNTTTNLYGTGFYRHG